MTTLNTEEEWVEKRLTQHQQMMLYGAWGEYYSEMLKSNKASPLACLPDRTVTEIREDLRTGDYIIRYKIKHP